MRYLWQPSPEIEAVILKAIFSRLDMGKIEDPCSKLQGIFDRKECARFRGSSAVAMTSSGMNRMQPAQLVKPALS
jgi:hypothetical protein